MKQRFLMRTAVVLCLVVVGARAADQDRDAVVRSMLDRSRLLEDAHFRVPVELWRQYRQAIGDEADRPDAVPVHMVAAEGVYAITETSTTSSSLTATVRLTVFDAIRCRNTPVLSAERTWEKVSVNGEPAKLAVVNGYLVFSPDEQGEYIITATAPLKSLSAYASGFTLSVSRTVRTLVKLESPTAWELTSRADGRRLVGTNKAGTHGGLALSPRNRLALHITRPVPRRQRPPRYELRGPVAWNIDAGRQQVSARLSVAILGGRTERLDLRIPAGAADLRVTGPDVRQIRRADRSVAVFLRGRIAEKTFLAISYDLPAVAEVAGFTPPMIADGNWAGGTLVVSNTAGGSELLADRMTGLRALALADVPAAAKPILAGPAVMAFDITARQWSGAVEVLDLGKFALRETIVDLAHFELLLQRDGAVLCKAAYEIRNRTKQFLRIRLPAGATPLLARVNEKPRPLAAVPGQADTYLLPLERSTASVKGLVSFPVDLVVLTRTAALAEKGVANIQLPRVDLPIAYAWCETYLPDGMEANAWSGPLRKVTQYANETAVAQLGYGRGEATEGYAPMARAGDGPPPMPPEGTGEVEGDENLPIPMPELAEEPGGKKPSAEEEKLKPSKLRSPSLQGVGGTVNAVSGSGTFASAKGKLGANYYRAGKELYDKGDLTRAADSLTNAVRLSPDGTTVANAKRLLSNIEVVQGKADLKSRGEKAAGAQVRQQIIVTNTAELGRQEALVEKGLALAREGKATEAQQQFAAAEQMSKKLILRGVDAREQQARLRSARKSLAKHEQRQHEQAKVINERFRALKDSGRYTEALQEGRKLRALNDELNARGGEFIVGGGFSANAALSADLEDLAVKVARQKAAQDVPFNSQPAPMGRPKGPPGMGHQAVSGLGKPAPAAAFVPLLTRSPSGGGGGSGGGGIRSGQLVEGMIVKLGTNRGRSVTARERDELLARLGSGQQHDQALTGLSELQRRAPNDSWTRGKRESLRRLRQLQIQESGVGTGRDQTVEQLSDTQWGKTPWFEEIKFPKEWAGVRLQRDAMSDAAANRAVMAKLRERRAELRIPDVPVEDVVDYLRDVTDVSIIPRWAILAAAGIDRSTPINIALRDVTCDTALREVLRQAGGAVELAYGIRKGVIYISTKADIDAQAATDRRGGRAAGQKEQLAALRKLAWQSGQAGTVDGAFVFTDTATPPTPARDMAGFTGSVSYGGHGRPDLSNSVFLVDRITGENVVNGTRLSAADQGSQDEGTAGWRRNTGTVTRSYDVRDLVTATGPDGREDDGKARKARLLKAIGATVRGASGDADGADAAGLWEVNGRIVVTETVGGQRRVAELLDQLREVRGPQVQIGANIGGQRAQGFLTSGGVVTLDAGDTVIVSDQVGRQGDIIGAADGGSDSELRQFIADNYKWQRDALGDSGVLYLPRGDTVAYAESDNNRPGHNTNSAYVRDMRGSRAPTIQPAAPVVTGDDLVQRLRRNWGQKIPVGSININVDQGGANELGINFTAGNNDVSYTVIDEAQYRTLMEVDADNRRAGRMLDANWSYQDAIIGTDALLSNRWTANASFGADAGNTIDVNGNPVSLQHEKYILINNGGYLTAVRAGQMTHWRQKSDVITFAAAPQAIEVPRLGKQYKLEKTLVNPTDDLTIRITYSWKGDGK